MKKPAKATVTVHIVDVNDNAPVFPPGHETAINVVENSGNYYMPQGLSKGPEGKQQLSVAPLVSKRTKLSSSCFC